MFWPMPRCVWFTSMLFCKGIHCLPLPATQISAASQGTHYIIHLFIDFTWLLPSSWWYAGKVHLISLGTQTQTTVFNALSQKPNNIFGVAQSKASSNQRARSPKQSTRVWPSINRAVHQAITEKVIIIFNFKLDSSTVWFIAHTSTSKACWAICSRQISHVCENLLQHAWQRLAHAWSCRSQLWTARQQPA